MASRGSTEHCREAHAASSWLKGGAAVAVVQMEMHTVAGTGYLLPPAHDLALSGPAALARLAPDETVILLHPPLPLAGVSIVMKRERQQK